MSVILLSRPSPNCCSLFTSASFTVSCCSFSAISFILDSRQECTAGEQAPSSSLLRVRGVGPVRRPSFLPLAFLLHSLLSLDSSLLAASGHYNRSLDGQHFATAVPHSCRTQRSLRRSLLINKASAEPCHLSRRPQGSSSKHDQVSSSLYNGREHSPASSDERERPPRCVT